MTAVEFNHRRRKSENFSQIYLNGDDERCGEVFITLSRTLIFHCSICESNFGNYDYFLDHLSAEHYEDFQGEVIDIDAEADIEILSEDNSLDKQIEDQYWKQDLDDDDYKCNEVLQKMEVHVQPTVAKIEEVYLEEPYSFSSTNSEHKVEGFEEIYVEKMKDEVDIEEKTSCIQFLDEQTSGSKKNKRTSRNNDLRSFSCKECGKAFKTNQKLRRHSAIHSDEREHQCSICGFAFKARVNLESHLKRHSGIKTISCGYCPKKFFTSTEATYHRRTHTGERPYVCPTCGMSFTNGGGLNVHVKKHYEPDFKCSYCEKGFYGKAEFNDHMLVHTKEKPWVCHICAARFPRYHSLVRHGKLMHNKTKIEFKRMRQTSK